MPALSETFVYEELLALERRGVVVVPFSVREPARAVTAQKALADRVIHLYRSGPLEVVLSMVSASICQRATKVLALLASDIVDADGDYPVGSYLPVHGWSQAGQAPPAEEMLRICMFILPTCLPKLLCMPRH
jgi:hypothetical protein